MLIMALFMLVACGRTEESIRTDILYAVFGDEDVQEYPIEYSGAKKTAEELVHDGQPLAYPDRES